MFKNSLRFLGISIHYGDGDRGRAQEVSGTLFKIESQRR
jgi:hypothetical protein